MSWAPPPEPVSWPIDPPKTFNGMRYDAVILRAPSGEDVLKATALQGNPLDQAHRLIETVSGVPYDLVKTLPIWMIYQMNGYFDLFTEAPEPGPLAAWREERREAAMAPPNGPPSPS